MINRYEACVSLSRTDWIRLIHFTECSTDYNCTEDEQWVKNFNHIIIKEIEKSAAQNPTVTHHVTEWRRLHDWLKKGTIGLRQTNPGKWLIKICQAIYDAIEEAWECEAREIDEAIAFIAMQNEVRCQDNFVYPRKRHENRSHRKTRAFNEKHVKSSSAWAKKMLDEGFLVLDYETTDINGEPVQIALIDSDDQTLINEIICPSEQISPGAQRVHGISMADVKDKPRFQDLYPLLRHHLESHTVIAYNAAFEKKITERTLDKYHLDNISGINWQCAMLEYSKFNPGKMSRWGKKGGWWKLTEAVEQEKITVSGSAHDALIDVRMTLQLIEAMAGKTV